MQVEEPSWRKPAGILLILLLIAIWCVAIASASPWIGQLHGLLQLVIYVTAGIIWIWILPLKRLLTWMETGKWRE